MAKYTKRSDGRYQTKITTDIIVPETGKKKTITVYGKSIAELNANKAKALEELDKGIYLLDRSTTFGAYKWRWLELYKSSRETNTYEGYRNILKNHTSCLDSLKLIDIRKSDVQAGYNALTGHDDLQRRFYQTVNQILRSAIDDNLIYKNVAPSIERTKKVRKKKRALTEMEKSHFDAGRFY